MMPNVVAQSSPYAAGYEDLRPHNHEPRVSFMHANEKGQHVLSIVQLPRESFRVNLYSAHARSNFCTDVLPSSK